MPRWPNPTPTLPFGPRLARRRIRAEVRVVREADLGSVANAIFAAIDGAVDDTVDYGVQHAKKLAPSRRVTDETHLRRRSFRDLSAAEIHDMPRSVRRGLDSQGRNVGIRGRAVSGARYGQVPQTTVRRSPAGSFAPGGVFVDRPVQKTDRFGKKLPMEAPAHPSTLREVKYDEYTNRPSMRHQNMQKALNARGRWELRSGRAIDQDGGVSTLGGRLRRQIHAQMTQRATKGGKATSWLLSPTPYARYVEFPTSRTAAQPYMRPAREAMKPRLVRNVERALGLAVARAKK